MRRSGAKMRVATVGESRVELLGWPIKHAGRRVDRRAPSQPRSAAARSDPPAGAAGQTIGSCAPQDGRDQRQHAVPMEAPDAADFEAGEPTVANHFVNGSVCDSENRGDLISCEKCREIVEMSHVASLPGSRAEFEKSN
jgi:hypothetical protein